MQKWLRSESVYLWTGEGKFYAYRRPFRRRKAFVKGPGARNRMKFRMEVK